MEHALRGDEIALVGHDTGAGPAVAPCAGNNFSKPGARAFNGLAIAWQSVDALAGHLLVQCDHLQHFIAELHDAARVLVRRGDLHVNLALVQQGQGAGLSGQYFGFFVHWFLT